MRLMERACACVVWPAACVCMRCVAGCARACALRVPSSKQLQVCTHAKSYTSRTVGVQVQGVDGRWIQ